jgi:hypothetical protein
MTSIRPTAFALAALAALAFAACGYPSFTFNGTGGATTTITGAGGTTSSTSATGGGGAGGGTTTTTTTTTTTGTGGMGGSCDVLHPGGGTCEYLPGAECGCEQAQKCGVINETTGEAKCVLIGANPLPVWSKCNSDGDCAAGTFCDHGTSVCKKICNNVGECPSGAQCIPAIKKNTASTEIPGLKVCTAHCDPMNGSPCGSNLTCYYDVAEAEFDCSATKKLGPGASCQFAGDCDKGLVCVGTQGGGSTCERWCHPTNDFVPSPFCVQFFEGKDYCVGVNVEVQYNGDSYGTCSP